MMFCWVKVLSGVKIGKGVVVGAGEGVNKNLEPYSICDGIPTKLIRYRLPEEIRGRFLKIDFNDFEKI